MPSKARLHNKSGKVKSFPKKVSNASQPSSSSSNAAVEAAGGSGEATSAAGSSENERQFQVELCWCVQHLEQGLENKNINPKTAEEWRKALGVLRSATQPAVRKRQLMRSLLGDYRAKMAAQEKRAKKVNSKIMFGDAPSTSGKSTFLRKSASLAGDNSFRFNFAPSLEGMNMEDPPAPGLVHAGPTAAATPSTISAASRTLEFNGNSFKFDFNVSPADNSVD